mmetsp:Transcript_20078/g.37721  ORF Transcript_20078/g.37721 Transcript_20078/m.37721 type:complete len:316 (-) Transcript_20078:151-1098(-)
MTDTRKRLRCGKRNTKSKSSLNSWIPTASDIMESLTEYGVEVEALRQRFEQNNRNGDRKNEHGAKSNDISSFPWHNLEKLLELLGMAMQYRGSEFQRCELAFVAFVLCSLLESTYLKRDVGSACRHRVRTVIGDIILAIEEPRESEKNPPMKFVWKIIEACETASSKLTVVESIPTSTSSVKKLRRLLAVKTLRTLVAKESAETCSSTNSKKIDEQNIITNANEILSRAMKVWKKSTPKNFEIVFASIRLADLAVGEIDDARNERAEFKSLCKIFCQHAPNLVRGRRKATYERKLQHLLKPLNYRYSLYVANRIE